MNPAAPAEAFGKDLVKTTVRTVPVNSSPSHYCVNWLRGVIETPGQRWRNVGHEHNCTAIRSTAPAAFCAFRTDNARRPRRRRRGTRRGCAEPYAFLCA